MAYNQNIPQATDRIKDSQSDLLNNFQSIKTLVDINHETFDSANEGKHLKVDLTDQTSSVPSPAAGQIVLYNADDVATGTGNKELWANSNGGVTYPITAGVRNTQGWSRIGGGVYLIWGRQVSDANTTSDTTIDVSHCPAS